MTIEQLEKRVAQLEQMILQIAKGNVNTIGKVDDTSNRVTAITPYTETKTAYYGEKEKTFYNVPNGDVTVIFSNYTGVYSVNRISDRVTVLFDILTEQTEVTINVK